MKYTKIIGILFLLFLTGCSQTNHDYGIIYEISYNGETDENEEAGLSSVQKNIYSTLSVPTLITSYDGLYFIVDCYHDQILYNSDLTESLLNWDVLTNEVHQPHTMASDGNVYLIDDTENNRVLVYKKQFTSEKDFDFVKVQEFDGVGTRPHYTVYNEETNTFYVLSSMTGELYCYQYNEASGLVEFTKVMSVPDLNQVYIRSFSIIEDKIYFISGNINSTITECRLKDLKILNLYPIPQELAGMVQMTPIQDYLYITVSTDQSGNTEMSNLIRTKSLTLLSEGEYESLYDIIPQTGTPYNMTYIDEAWYLTVHRQVPIDSIWKFEIIENEISEIETFY